MVTAGPCVLLSKSHQTAEKPKRIPQQPHHSSSGRPPERLSLRGMSTTRDEGRGTGLFTWVLCGYKIFKNSCGRPRGQAVSGAPWLGDDRMNVVLTAVPPALRFYALSSRYALRTARTRSGNDAVAADAGGTFSDVRRRFAACRVKRQRALLLLQPASPHFASQPRKENILIHENK